ncbi:MAG: hypothetical protein ACLSX0_01465 [Anaerostipes caccae]|jgi:predicted nucleic acid-binding Zn ribbon protein
MENKQLSEEEKSALKANLAKKRRRQKRNEVCFGTLIFAMIVFLIFCYFKAQA